MLSSNTFNATNISRITIKCLTLFHIFRHSTADVKKNINLTRPDDEE